MKSELARMFLGKGFWIALVLAVAGMIAGTPLPKQEGLLQTGWFLEAFEKMISSKSVCYLLPAGAVLAWSDSFLYEWKGGFLKSALPRTGRRAYVENKILTVACSGFCVWVIAGLLVLFGYFLFFFPLEETGKIRLTAVWEALEPLLRCGLIGAVFASLGGFCGVLGGSGYLAFGIPFVFYYFCIILQERYFPYALWLYTPQWISGSAQWGGRGEGLWLFLLLLLFLFAGAHAAVMYAKLEEL